MDARAIVDSGFVAALWDERDSLHRWAADTAAQVRGPWLTCEGCLSEVVFLLGDSVGPAAVLNFYGRIERGLIISLHLIPEELLKVTAETARYHGRQVDFADACLMTLSDRYPRLPIVTTDARDFPIYLRGRSPRKLILPG